jgi:phosphoglycerate dehydrogenase-like enzyme
MKICLSEFAYSSEKKVFDEAFREYEILLIDNAGHLIQGEGKPDVALVSYEIMFRARKNSEFHKKYLDLIDGCGFVQGSWAGVDGQVAQSLIKHSNIFSHGGGIHAIPIATYVFAQILRSVKSIDDHIHLQKEKKWDPMFSTGELTDMVIGITGFGGIGKEVARLAKAFRMTVYATKRTPVASDNLDQLFRATEVNKMLPKCDFVVNCLPSSEETMRVFSKQQFGLMKNSAMFINVGRGETVNEDDLAIALESGEILCAALDVIDSEPLRQESPLWTLKNCYITPHDSAWGPKAPIRAINLFLDNFKKFKEGKKLTNQV